MGDIAYREILYNAPFAYATHRIIRNGDGKAVDYRFTEVNDAFSQMTGLKKEDLVGHTVRDAMPAINKDSFDWIEFYADIAENRKSLSFEQYTEHLGKWFRIHAYSHSKDNFTTIFIDLTAEKKQAAELEGFFTINLDLLCIADTEGNFIKVNREWEKVLGYSIEELMRHKFLEFVHPDDLEATMEAISQLAANQEVLNFVNRYRDSDGSYHYIEW